MKNVVHDRQARGRTRTGWLNARHTFSFGSFNDPSRMGFRALRVINEDVIAGGSGFAEHAHDHFEILTFMLEGTLEHTDSAGNQGSLHAGDVQLISAGSGIRHAERNPSANEPTHLFQIWLHGEGDSRPPHYQILLGALARRGGQPRLVASGRNEPDTLNLRAPVDIWFGTAAPGEACSHKVAPSRFAWLQMLDGVVQAVVDDEPHPLELRGGDALQLATVRGLTLEAVTPARWLWFDLA